jgi:hypothetical protein
MHESTRANLTTWAFEPIHAIPCLKVPPRREPSARLGRLEQLSSYFEVPQVWQFVCLEANFMVRILDISFHAFLMPARTRKLLVDVATWGK